MSVVGPRGPDSSLHRGLGAPLDAAKPNDRGTVPARVTPTSRVLYLPAPSVLEDLAAAAGTDAAVVAERIGDDGALEAAVTAMGFLGRRVISLGTATAYHLPVAQVVADLVERAAGSPLPGRDALATAVHEALANAVLHGNLGLPGLREGGSRSLADYVVEMRRRLDVPAFAERRVTVGICWDEAAAHVSVLDSGNGFAWERAFEPRRHHAGPTAAGGRGLLLMSALAENVSFSLGGRLVTLRFSRGEVEMQKPCSGARA